MQKPIRYYIDIDGCIMPSIFPNKFYNTPWEKLEIIKEAYEKVLTEKPQLYTNFIDFFKAISEDKSTESINFITGRQENIFGWLTDYQLKPLDIINATYRIHYFYGKAMHTQESYNSFKVNRILDDLEFDQFKGVIAVYDDLTNYFEMLRKKCNLEVNCYERNSNESWR